MPRSAEIHDIRENASNMPKFSKSGVPDSLNDVRRIAFYDSKAILDCSEYLREVHDDHDLSRIVRHSLREFFEIYEYFWGRANKNKQNAAEESLHFMPLFHSNGVRHANAIADLSPEKYKNDPDFQPLERRTTLQVKRTRDSKIISTLKDVYRLSSDGATVGHIILAKATLTRIKLEHRLHTYADLPQLKELENG